MIKTACSVFLFLTGFTSFFAQAASVTIKDVRSYQAPDHLRVVFDVSRSPIYRLYALKNPDRIVVDVKDAYLAKPFVLADISGSSVTNVRTGKPSKSGLQVVFDLKGEVLPRAFVLQPAGEYGHRLVIDLHEREQSLPPPEKEVEKPAQHSRPEEWLIAIDAGHGGDDPGAIGRRYRTREKDVVLAIAKELARQVAATPGMRPLLVRKSNYYISLGERPRIAGKHHADIFISIHADAVPGRRRARGSSVYALTQRGASDSIARLLADKENAADLLGGVSRTGAKDQSLHKVLMDLEYTASIGFSLDLAADVLKELERIGPLHRRSVGQAGFAVLKSPKIPSILVETAFISNPSEEKKLRNKRFQRKVAKAILKGVKHFFSRKNFSPRAKTTVAGSGTRNNTNRDHTRRHIVQRGESLTSIARKYDVHIDTLRFANNLRSDKLVAGSKLLIP